MKNPYGVSFWSCYIANTALMVAISLLFRYADFVTFLGGDELTLGWIVGVGTVGSLLMRIWQGAGIDRLGPRKVWLWSVLLFVISVGAHTLVTSLDGPVVYGLRILFSVSVAGAFGSSLTYISRTVPQHRLAEIIGTLGTSGFVGMAIGPKLGDVISGGANIGRPELDLMFQVAAALGCLSLVGIWFGTQGVVVPDIRRRPPLLWLIRRYNPGLILMVGIAMGIGIALPGTFLRPYTAELSIDKMQIYFFVYTATAFVVRMCTRRMTDRFGVRPMVILGMGNMILSMLAYMFVTSYEMLCVPALFAGMSHAFLFPAVVAGSSTAFPARYRGLGTTLILAMLDIGVLIGAPLIGTILDVAESLGLQPYPTMFTTVAILLTTVTLIYVLRKPRRALSSKAPKKIVVQRNITVREKEETQPTTV